MAKEETVAAVPLKKASELSGLTTHMIIYLDRIDVLKASGSPRARGRRRLFTFCDVLFLRLIAELLAKGIEVKRLGQALKRAKSEADAWLDVKKQPRHYLVTDGTEVFIRRKGRLESKTVDRQFAFTFVLDLAMAHAPLADVWPRGVKKRA